MSLRTRIETALFRTVLGLPPGVVRRLAGRPVEVDGQRLAPETQLMLRLQHLAPDPPVESLPIAEGRALLRKQAVMAGGGPRAGVVETDLELPGAVGPLRARSYARAGSEPGPTLLFLHGGGWVYGDLESHDGPCRLIADRGRVRVLSVEYRLAPEAAYPAALDDALAVLRDVDARRGELGITALAVGGDSAGGALAAAVAIEAAREGIALAHQVLIYPGTDMAGTRRSRTTYGQGFYLTQAFMDLAREAYLPDREMLADPRASVLEADLPDGLAPAYVVTAGFDPLRDEGEAYAARLREAGVRAEQVRYPDQIHGFINYDHVCATSRAAADDMLARFRELLG